MQYQHESNHLKSNKITVTLYQNVHQVNLN